MKKYFTFSALIFLMYFSLSAQSDTTIFAPIGAEWYYNPEQVQKPWGQEPLQARFLVEKDTFLLGYHARMIGCYVNNEGLFYRVDSLTKYVATIGSKVYYKVNDKFVLLFDFNANVGDTINSLVEEFGINSGCQANFGNYPKSFKYEVLAESTIDKGVELKVQFGLPLDFDPGGWSPGDLIIERLGSLNWGGFWWGCPYACGTLNGFLKCYVDQDIYWHNPYFEEEECEVILSAKHPKIQTFQVQPNPFEEYFKLPVEAKEIVILNSLGQKVKFVHNDDQIDLGEQPAGIYYVSFRIGEDLFSSRLIKSR